MLHQLDLIMKKVNAATAKITIVRHNEEMRLCISIQANTIKDVSKLSVEAANLANALQLPVIISGTPEVLDATANDELMTWSDSYLPVNDSFKSVVDSKALLDVANSKVKKKSTVKATSASPVETKAADAGVKSIAALDNTTSTDKIASPVEEHAQVEETDLLAFLNGVDE